MNMPIKLVGSPDGPTKFVPELGQEVGTFLEDTQGKTLNWHVPLNMRGDFRPSDLANVDNEKTYRTDALGYLLCYGYTKNAGERCKKRAQNRYPRCSLHGGSLHPLDRIDKTPGPDEKGPELTRYQLFCKGELTVDDLDDEELAMCGFRGKNNVIYRPKNVPREMVQEFQKTIFERAQAQLRSLTVDAAKTVGEIMLNKKNEPDIRLKAALATLERNLGKTPNVIALTSDKPFEEVFSDVFTGSREESRQRRAIESERVYAEEVPLSDIGSGLESDNGAESVARHQDSTDSSNDTQRRSGVSGIDFGLTEGAEQDSRDSRLFARNEAIITPVIEIKPFEYDLSDHRAEIKKETKKRYAQRAAEDSDKYVKEEKIMNDGTIWVKYRLLTSMPTKGQEKKRKVYTLSDFE